MKKFFAFFVAVSVCMAGFAAMAVNVTVKKASSVQKQEVSGLDSVTNGSLVPGVLGLVTSVAALTKEQKGLEAECVPTTTELNWVNNMVKEYAKVGEVKAEDMLDDDLCNGETYTYSVQVSKPNNMKPCAASTFSEDGVIWNGYPKAEVAEYCADGVGDVCSASKKKKVSNIYTIFGKIDFTDQDYTVDEMNMYIKMMEKMEKCAPEKISARKREAYAKFLKDTITGAGTKTNTANVWEAVSNLTGNAGSGVQSLAPTVLQMLGN